MSDIDVWKVRNEDTLQMEELRIPSSERPNTRIFEHKGAKYRRDALLRVEHGQMVRGSEKGPEVVVQRNIEGVVGWQFDQWDPRFDKHDTDPRSSSYGQPVFGSRQDVQRGLARMKDAGQNADYGEGLSRIKP